ncbi:MAG: four helix bundle protein [Flavisolibacter sp.]
MFLELNHKHLDIYKFSRSLVKACYLSTKQFPPEEKFALTQQLRRAALSVFLNLSEGCSRKSLIERKRFFQISRGSLIEVDAAFEIASDLGYTSKENLTDLGELIIKCFKILTKMVNGQWGMVNGE